MKFCFEKRARCDLAKALAQHGCEDVNATVDLIERLTAKYYAAFIERGRLPARRFDGEAKRLLVHANIVCCRLDVISRTTRRRLEGARQVRRERLSLPEYSEAVNDVCMFAVHALEKGKQVAARRDAAVDRALGRLTDDIRAIWEEETGLKMPRLRTTSTEVDATWRQVRRLQQHPLWIAYNALGIFLDAEDVNRLVEIDR